jgi:hypothetical protein
MPIMSSSPVLQASQSGSAGLTALDRQIAYMAAVEPLQSLLASGTWQMRLQRLFGLPPTTKYADPHLEAVRRLAVIAAHGSEHAVRSETAAFLRLGFSVTDAETVNRIAARHHRAVSPKPISIAGLMLLIAAASWWISAAAGELLGDMLIGAVCAMLLLIAILSSMVRVVGSSALRSSGKALR